jgi:DNA-binding MarR family transcriptional regulator
VLLSSHSSDTKETTSRRDGQVRASAVAKKSAVAGEQRERSQARAGSPQNPWASLDAGRRLGARAIMFHQAVADFLGLNMSDIRCWNLASDKAPITPGELAELTGLTTGAVTGVIDRLEEAGLVRRQPDINDRRRILVYPVVAQERKVASLYEGLGRAMMALATHYSPEQLAVISDFLASAEKIFFEQTVKLRDLTLRSAKAKSATR